MCWWASAPRVKAGARRRPDDVIAPDDTQSSAPALNSRLLSAEKHAWPHTTCVRELASPTTRDRIGLFGLIVIARDHRVRPSLPSAGLWPQTRMRRPDFDRVKARSNNGPWY
jgi:hypothetical protein